MQMTLEGLKAILENPTTIAAITEKTEFEFIINENAQMRTAQRNMMAALINRYFSRHTCGEAHQHKYEFKKLSVQVYSGFISVLLVVGMKEDEGTMAEIFARSRVHAFIHIRGGVRADGKVASTDRSKRMTGLFNVCGLSC